MSVSTLPTAFVGDGALHADALVRGIPLVPRNLGLALLHGYRATISHVYGDVCKYYPSCSAYAVGSVQQYGLAKGTAMAARRLARCHPWAVGGIDDVPSNPRFGHELTRHGFVVPSGKD
ncbi:membrane protein insertion efficiency factor YidD [Microbacterium sp. zg.Y909]|uniref:membrane protein insertion efficiency factor YidD n=1 Tax=Microbacterium sp. zg.Y909 TaxID=2969413 RepID=UPI00214BCA65|nr:membrane protein insertion efficiency factor YidD [Microbacterium sp. zg.Y909]MCR2824921.1 membrane protein insertion efficiency factor YidD [Microbacterium sp. zg.Y909]